jgi:hypothetical protein
MREDYRKSGIDMIGDVPWGTHFCHFYNSKEDLIDIQVPFLKTGLENNEFCMWIISEPLNVADAKSALNNALKNLDNYIEKGQLEILDANEWYTKLGIFDADRILGDGLKRKKRL